MGNVGNSGVYVIKVFFTKQFLLFLAVGSIAAVLHWSARLLLNVWMPFAIAVIVAYGVGITVGFLLNSVFVFPNSGKPKPALDKTKPHLDKLSSRPQTIPNKIHS